MSRFLPMLVGILLAPTTAWAQWVCPDPADYTTDQPTLGTMPLGYDCDTSKGHLDANQCDESIYSEPLEPNGRLFIWLAATGASPENNRHILNMASFAGYKVLAPSWSNRWSTFVYCSDANYLGGPCATDCVLPARREIQYGRNVDGGDAHPVSRLEGVEHRVAMALEQLHASNPNDGWDDYCEPDPEHGTRVRWEEIVVGGHSVGANQAQFISYTVDTHGAFMVEGGYDFCSVEYVDLLALPAELADPTELVNTTGAEVDYYFDTPDASDPIDRVFALHRDDVYPSADWPELPPSFSYLIPDAIDTSTNEPYTGEVYDIDGTGAYADEPILATSQTPAATCSGDYPDHGSMASDGCLPKGLTGGAVLDDPEDPGATAEAHVFEAYLDALCSLQYQ